MKFLRLIRIMIFLVFPTLLWACGGGGGGAAGGAGQNTAPLVTGVAATGAPIAGTVTLKDKKGLVRGPMATGLDGSFSLDVTDLTPPFLLKAEWTAGAQTHRLFSAATQAGSAHINPLSDLALRLATGADPAAVFGAPGAIPEMTQISKTALAAALTQLQTLLSPLLTDYGIENFDPFSGPYTASPENRLDAMLDVIGFKTENGQLTLTNKLDGAVIAAGSLAHPAGIAIDHTKAPDKAVLTDIREITARVGILCSLMNQGETLTAGKLEGLFVPEPDYGTSNGHTRPQDVTSIVQIFGPGGSNSNGPLRAIRNVRLVADLTADYADRGVSKVYLLNYDFLHENGLVSRGNNVTFGREEASGQWKFIGDPANAPAGNNYGGVWITSTDNSGSSGTLAGNNYGAIRGRYLTTTNLGTLGTLHGSYDNNSGWEAITPGTWDTNDPFSLTAEAPASNNLWQVSQNGNTLEIVYKDGENFTKYAEFNLDNSALRLRASAASGWSPAALLAPLFTGEKTVYQGAPVTTPGGYFEAGGQVMIFFTWEGGGNSFIGGIRMLPPVNNELSAEVLVMGQFDRSSLSLGNKFLLLTLLSDPLSAAQLAGQTLMIDGAAIPLPPSGGFLQSPVSGQVVTWNGGTSTLAAGFTADKAISGEVLTSANSQDAAVRLYIESPEGYYPEIGLFQGSYTLNATAGDDTGNHGVTFIATSAGAAPRVWATSDCNSSPGSWGTSWADNCGGHSLHQLNSGSWGAAVAGSYGSDKGWPAFAGGAAGTLVPNAVSSPAPGEQHANLP